MLRYRTPSSVGTASAFTGGFRLLNGMAISLSAADAGRYENSTMPYTVLSDRRPAATRPCPTGSKPSNQPSTSSVAWPLTSSRQHAVTVRYYRATRRCTGSHVCLAALIARVDGVVRRWQRCHRPPDNG